MANWTWYDWTGVAIAQPVSKQVDILAINGTLLQLNETIPQARLGQQGNDTAPAWLHLILSSEKHGRSETFWTPPGTLKIAPLADPKIQVTARHSDDGDLVFVVSSPADATASAPWVWLEHPEGVIGYFTEDLGANRTSKASNLFWLVPGASRQVRFVVQFDRTDGAWKNAITARSIWNIAH